MSEKYTIDNAKNDIQNLQSQNLYDFQEIKRLNELINDYEKRVLQAINFNNQINKKIQYNYENLKKTALERIKYLEDELSSASGGSGLTISQINKLNEAYTHSQSYHVSEEEISTITSQLTNDSDFVNSSYVDNAISGIDGSGLTSTQINQLNESYTHSQSYHVSEEEISDIDTQLDNIMKDFNDHITNHPSGDIDNIINSLEPSNNDIPNVYFTGDISGMSKEVEKILTFSYKSNTKKINGFVKMKWQGTSSIAYPKKNFTIKMFKDEGCLNKDKHTFKNWGYETNKYVLKANYIDHSHARNIVSARLWNDVVKSRKDYSLLPTEYQSMPNGGGIDGFPIKVYINGVYQGLYTWNIGKEGWTYGMKSEKESYAVLCGENYASGCFRAVANIDERDWSLEYPDTLQNSIKTSWNNAINFVMNNSGNAFKNGLSTYFDVNSLIDYYIFAYFSCGLDSMGKNQIYTTYDGTKWYAHMYDMDSTWGLYWNGSKFVSSSYRCQDDYESMTNNRGGNLLYIKLVENFGEEIYERYIELRNTVLRIDNVIDRFERFTDLIPNDLYEEDISIYNNIPSSSTNNIQQIRKFIVERTNYVDGKIAELNTTDIPITGLTLNKSNTTVNVDSNDILTVSYTPTNTTQRGVEWSSSDTSKATVIDGVVTGVGEGNCVITVTSTHNSSLKATCNVNIEENVDIEEPDIGEPDYTSLELSSIQKEKPFTLYDGALELNNQTVFADITLDVSTPNQNILSIGLGIDTWTGNNVTRIHCYYPSNPSGSARQLQVSLNGKLITRDNTTITNNKLKMALNANGIYVNGIKVNISIESEDFIAFVAQKTTQIGSLEGSARSKATYNGIRIYNKLLSVEELIALTII